MRIAHFYFSPSIGIFSEFSIFRQFSSFSLKYKVGNVILVFTMCFIVQLPVKGTCVSTNGLCVNILIYQPYMFHEVIHHTISSINQSINREPGCKYILCSRLLIFYSKVPCIDVSWNCTFVHLSINIHNVSKCCPLIYTWVCVYYNFIFCRGCCWYCCCSYMLIYFWLVINCQ